MNKVLLTGNLTKDAELSFTASSGLAIAKFTIANNVGYGEKKEVNFVNCVLFGKRAESLANYLVKGTSVVLDGRLKLDSYDKQDGTKGYSTSVLIDGLDITKFVNEKPLDMTPVDGTDKPF